MMYVSIWGRACPTGVYWFHYESEDWPNDRTALAGVGAELTHGTEDALAVFRIDFESSRVLNPRLIFFGLAKDCCSGLERQADQGSWKALRHAL